MRLTPKMIEDRIAELIRSPLNTLKLVDQAAFDMPVIGYANGGDALFGVSRYDNGEPGMNPAEWLESKYGRSYPPQKTTVISFALPIPRAIIEKMGEEQFKPSLEWSLNLMYGMEFIRHMATQLEAFFEQHGIDAVSPIADERVQRMRIEKYGLSTNWSEPIAAFICGLGTLRPPDNIITRLGSCVRLGSIIVASKLPPMKRDYSDPSEYCNGRHHCMACAKRCPVGAISEHGVDRSLCMKYQAIYVRRLVKDEYGYDGVYGCGLCMTGVPCDAQRPDSKRAQ